MSVDELPIRAAETFFQRWDHQLTAVGTVLLVLLVVFLVDRAFKRRGRALAQRVTGGGELDPVLETRLRFVRRLVEAVIVVIGLMIAMSQFTALDRFAASILASSAIAAAVIGFAAQQTIGNVIAGVMLAVTQPIRIGDRVTFEEHSGVVEDIRLTHTFLQTGGDARIIVPNGKLAGSVVRNDSIVTETVAVEVEVWLANEVDELRALEVIEAGIEGAQATIKAVTFEGTTLAVSGEPSSPVERAVREAQLRREVVQALRSASLR
jgi:small conductance mechanosensitive channel